MTTRHAFAAIVGAALLATPANAEPNGELNRSLDRLESMLRKLQDTERNLQTEVDGLKVQIRQIQDEIRSLRQLPSLPPSISKRETFDLSPRMGRVRLTNEFLEEMSVVVNGVSYRLLPGQTRTIQVPPGLFTYQVLQLQRTIQERMIEPGEEKPIRIFTQR